MKTPPPCATWKGGCSVLVHGLEDDLPVPDDGVHVEDVAGDEPLEHVERAAIAEGVDGGPELVGALDLLHADGGRLRPRLENPRQRRRLGEAARSRASFTTCTKSGTRMPKLRAFMRSASLSRK